MFETTNQHWFRQCSQTTMTIGAIKNTPIPSHYRLIGFPILWAIIIPSKPGRIKSPIAINSPGYFSMVFVAFALALKANIPKFKAIARVAVGAAPAIKPPALRNGSING